MEQFFVALLPHTNVHVEWVAILTLNNTRDEL